MLLKKIFGFTLPNFGVHQVSTVVSIIEKVMIDYLVSLFELTFSWTMGMLQMKKPE